MTLKLKRALTGIILALSLAAPVAAHPVSDAKDGIAAYARHDYTTALRLFRPLAEQGNGIAQYKIGLMYFNGEGVAQNYPEAMQWFRKAAVKRSYGDGELCAGDISGKCDPFASFKAQATEISYKTAYETATELSAKYFIGLMYRSGAGVPQDYAEALKWLRPSADQGNSSARFLVGAMYLGAESVPQSDAETVKWSRLAADQGVASAQSLLGFMYMNGRGVPQSDTEAVKWFRKAADQGDARAQFHLGDMYYFGHGVPQDHVSAYVWLNLSASRGQKSADFIRGEVAKNLTPSQIAEAQKFAREWKPVLIEDQLTKLESTLSDAPIPSKLAFPKASVVRSDPLEDSASAYARRDYATTMRLLRPLADKGSTLAQNNLGAMYAQGQGVPSGAEPNESANSNPFANFDLKATKLNYETESGRPISMADIFTALFLVAILAAIVCWAFSLFASPSVLFRPHIEDSTPVLPRLVTTKTWIKERYNRLRKARATHRAQGLQTIKPETLRRIRFLQIPLTAIWVLVGGGLAVQRTLNPPPYDYQATIDLKVHPIASLLGALSPYVILAPFVYWFFGWTARRITRRYEARYKVCEFCAETIKTAAKVCRYCGRDLTGHGPSTASRS